MLFLYAFIRLLLLYLVAALILGLIPVNRHFREHDDGMLVYLLSNGIHSDIVLPLHSGDIFWDDFFRDSESIQKIPGVKYIAFGWGNRLFYLNTPEWNDLTPSIAVNALFIKTEPAMHVTFYSYTPVSGDLCISIKINHDQLKHLSEFVKSSFVTDSHGHPVKI